MEPEKLAKELLEKYQLCMPDKYKTDVEGIANAEGLIIYYTDIGESLGLLVYDDDAAFIKINNKIRESGMIRFTIAHELGHYIINKNRIILKHGLKYHEFYNYNPQTKEEMEANAFAAELLMPKRKFNKFTKDKKLNFNLIKEIAQTFDVTLSAAAIRYANIGRLPIAVILSRNQKIIWYFISEYFPFKQISKNLTLKYETGAHKIFREKQTLDAPILIEAYYWFEDKILHRDKRNSMLWEDSFYLPYYYSVLTILWDYDPYNS
jgi:Zn-dependent peptidase ImmA (M78 family)